MNKASLHNGAGPGSSISLAPETIRVRNALIEKFSGEPLEDMQNFMAMALSKETDEFRRLGVLAARIYLLRNRVAKLREFNRDPSLASLPDLDTTTLSLSLPSDEPPISNDEEIETDPEIWSRIQMTEPGEVNGVRFLTGTIIDTQTADAEKLINSGKAIRIDEEGAIIDHHEKDFVEVEPDTLSDTSSTAKNDDSELITESDDGSANQIDDEEIKDDENTVEENQTPDEAIDEDPETPKP